MQGVFLNVPTIIELQPIEKAGTETTMDLFTLFVKHPEFNRVAPDSDANVKVGHDQSVPPVILVMQ